MIEAVFVFAFVSALFEFVILMKLKPRTRLRILGSQAWVNVIHITVIGANLLIHYGTITGSMVAITSGLVTFAIIPFTRWLSGFIYNNKYYEGVFKYPPELLT